MDKSFIQEAFKQVYLTEDAEEFSLNVSGPDDTESFMDIVNSDEYSDDEMISDVYDLEAEAKEDLKQSYIGKVILDCNVCHSNVFFNKDEITENEDGICCEEIECPYCMSNEGYTIIGEVKPYQEEEDVDIDDIESAEIPEEEPETEEATDDIDVEEPEEDEDLEEGIEDVYDKAYRIIKNKQVTIGGKKCRITEVTGLSNVDESKPDSVSVKNIDTVRVTFGNNKQKEVDVKDLDKPLKEGLKADKVKALSRNDRINGRKGLGRGKGLEASDDIRGPKYKELNECGDPEVMEEGAIGSALGAAAAITRSPAGAIRGAQIGDKIGDAVGSMFNDDSVEESLEEGEGTKTDDIYDDIADLVDNESLKEGIEDVSINTEDENITMTTKEDGGVVVETSPKEEFNDEPVEEFSGDEMIAPIEPETESDVEDAIESNGEEEEMPEDEMFDELPEDEFGEEAPEDEFEEFDEESFDSLGESYLKRCYENVTSFKTSNIALNENKQFIIEGKIGFDSGNKKDTQFVFSTKSNDNGKLKLEGYNKQISRGKKTFKLNCSVNGKALICESLNYNYKGKNDLNESVRVYGTVKRK